MKLKYLFIITALSVGSAEACESMFDCEIGSRCSKRGLNVDGVCVGGMSPGNDNDDEPYEDAFNEEEGDTCLFDIDCGIGGQCVKDSGINGVCM
jgi:hypothetical protein